MRSSRRCRRGDRSRAGSRGRRTPWPRRRSGGRRARRASRRTAVCRGTTPRMSGTERHPSQPSSMLGPERGHDRVDEHGERDLRRVGVARVAEHLDDAHLLRHVHLVGGEAGAVVLAHGLDHVVDEALDLRPSRSRRRPPGPPPSAAPGGRAGRPSESPCRPLPRGRIVARRPPAPAGPGATAARALTTISARIRGGGTTRGSAAGRPRPARGTRGPGTRP